MTDVKIILNDSHRAEITRKIRKIFTGNNLKIASAFIGKGAETQVPSNAKLICDIGMGGTNPDALEKLHTKLGDNLRCAKSFHPKMYVSSAGCVIGSANLSNNGIGFLSDGALVEAAAFIPADSDATASAVAWFNEMWETADIVDAGHIERARSAWKRPKLNTPEFNAKSLDFLEALKELPSDDGDWRIVVTYTELSKEAKQATDELTETVKLDHNLNQSSSVETYEWGCSWEKKGYHILGIHLGPRNGITVQPYRYLTEQKLQNGNYLCFFEKLNWSATGLPAIPKAYETSNGYLSKLISEKKNHPKDKWNGKFFKGSKFAKELKKFIDHQ